MMVAPRRLFPISVWLLCALIAAGGCAAPPGAPDAGTGTEPPNLERLVSTAQRTRSQIQAELSHSPDSELQESLRILDSILAYAARVKADPDQFDPEKIDDYNRKIGIVQGNIERFRDPKYRVSVSFPGGGYRIDDLPGREKRRLRDLAATVAGTVADLQRRHPFRSVRITLRSVGYTDETPIAAGTRLEAVIRHEIEDLAPPGPARRRQYNQILSRLRATNANQFVLSQSRSALESEGSAEFVQKITGMGEALPSRDGSRSYRPSDPRRRACLVSAFVEIVL